MLLRAVPVLIIVAGLCLTPARANVVDLTTAGSSGTLVSSCPVCTGGTTTAVFTQVAPQPTGTGYIDPFLRIQSKGTEQGYNMTYRPVQFDEKTVMGSVNYDHDLLLSSLQVINIGGVDYRRFLLDINETNTTTGRLLSLDRLQLFLSPTPISNNTSYVFANNNQSKPGTLNGTTKVFDIDFTNSSGTNYTTDNYIKLNYSLNSGSGSGDMYFDVPNVVFTSCAGCGDYLTLYSKFGETIASDAGFEEWTGLQRTSTITSSVPEPFSVILLAGIVLLVLRPLLMHAKRATKAA